MNPNPSERTVLHSVAMRYTHAMPDLTLQYGDAILVTIDGKRVQLTLARGADGRMVGQHRNGSEYPITGSAIAAAPPPGDPLRGYDTLDIDALAMSLLQGIAHRHQSYDSARDDLRKLDGLWGRATLAIDDGGETALSKPLVDSMLEMHTALIMSEITSGDIENEDSLRELEAFEREMEEGFPLEAYDEPN